MRNIICFLLIFSLVILNTQCTVTFTDLTKPFVNNIYSNSPGACTFQYDIVLYTTTINEFIDAITISTGFMNGIQVIEQVTFLRRIKFNVIFNVNENGVFNILVGGNQVANSSVSYDCKEMPTPLVNLNPDKSFSQHLTSTESGMYNYLLLLNENLDKKFIYSEATQISVPNNYDCTLTPFTYRNYLLQCKIKALIDSEPVFTLTIRDTYSNFSTIILNTPLVNDSRDPLLFTDTYADISSDSNPRKFIYSLSYLMGYPFSLFYFSNIGGLVSKGSILASDEDLYVIYNVNYVDQVELVTLESGFYINSTYKLNTTYQYDNIATGNEYDIELGGIHSETTTAIDVFCSSPSGFYNEVNFESAYGFVMNMDNYQYPYGVTGRVGYSLDFKFTNIIPIYNQTMEISLGNHQCYSGLPPRNINNYGLITISGGLSQLEYRKLSQYSCLIRINVVTSRVPKIIEITMGEIVFHDIDVVDIMGDEYVFEKYIDSRNTKEKIYNFQFDYIITLNNAGDRHMINSLSRTVFPPFPLIPGDLITPENALLNRKFSISSISYLINNVDVTLNDCNNLMYINFTSVDIYQRVFLSIFGNDIIGYWDENFHLYSIPFYIPRGLVSSLIEFKITYMSSIVYSYELPSNYQLKIQSEYSDRQGPTVIDFNVSLPLSNSFGGNISWTFTIQDPYSGFKNGSVSIVSNLEPYRPIKVFHFYPQDNQIDTDELTFVLELDIPESCQTQSFYIYSMILYDNGDVRSEYSYQNRNPVNELYINPLLLFLIIPNKINELKIDVTCFVSRNDVAAPFIMALTPLVELNPPKASIQFTVFDNESSIETETYLPVCYLHAIFFKKLSTTATVIQPGTNSVQFQCDFPDIPYAFAYPGDSMSLSIYGYSDVQFNIGGSTTNDLIEMGYNVTYSYPFTVPGTGLQPLIKDVIPRFTNQDKTITIVGSGFGADGDLIVNMNGVSYSSITPISTILIIVNNITPISVPFNITISSSSQPIISNSYLVVPLIIDNGNGNTTSPPINDCGINKCGGPSNGNCVSGKCICIDPWFGVDCLSQNIITTPTINTTNPDIITDYNTTLPDGKEVKLVSLISIYSIKEFSYDGSLVHEYVFDKWIYTNTTSTLTNSNIEEYSYQTNFTTINSDSTPSSSNITRVKVTVQYFKDRDTVLFANEKFEMLPSSVKYQVQLSSYKFKSELNSLQLMMSVSLESQVQNQDGCSYQESGDINNNSEYVKLQIDTHSLYGRFIKRGIIDNRIQSISNTIYNSSNSTGSQSQSFLGINIPHYRSQALIDPDFSLLIDSKSASEQINSICNNEISNDESGLSKAQLIGIIIGSIGFFLIIVISVTYYFYKKKKYAKLNKTLQMKLQQGIQ